MTIHFMREALDHEQSPVQVSPVTSVSVERLALPPGRVYCVSATYADGSRQRLDVTDDESLHGDVREHDPAHGPGRFLRSGHVDGFRQHPSNPRSIEIYDGWGRGVVSVGLPERLLEWETGPRRGRAALLGLLLPFTLALDLGTLPFQWIGAWLLFKDGPPI